MLLPVIPFGMVYFFYIERFLSEQGLGLGRMSQLAVYCVWRSGSSVVRTPLALLPAIPYGMVYLFILRTFYPKRASLKW